MVPSGWLNKSVDDNISFSGGSQPPRDTFRFEPSEGYIRLIQIRDYKTDKFTTYIPKHLAKKYCSKDNVMIGRYGPPIFQILRGIEGAYNVALIKATPKIGVEQTFMYYFLKRDDLLQIIESHSQRTSGQTGIEMDVLKSFPMHLPPLPEQRKIAKILSTWDKAISTTERLIDNSKQQKKALMQQLLTGKKRLLDDTGKPFESEWVEVTVGGLGTIYSGGTPSTSNEEYWDGDIDWITPTDITKQDSVYINSSVRRITAEGLKNSSAKLVPKGALLVCTRATIGEMAITAHEMCTNQGFKNIVPNNKTNIEFVFYLLTYEKHKLVSKASGSTFLELSKSAFESMKFRVPVIEEQQKIASVLTNADNEIELLEQQHADLKQEKKALMQQLLNGKRRVKLDDKEVT